MEYRKLEKLGVSSSLLGFGCMRFPTLSDGRINEPEAEAMLDKAIEAGVTYLDTAYPYHGGQSETILGRIIQKYDRNKLLIATKLPVWLVKTTEDVERYFKEQLERLQTDYVDFYLLHAMNMDRWNRMQELGVIDVLKRLKEEGKIKFIGFSFHDKYETFETLAEYGGWDFCQIQLNYVDTEIQAGLKGYELATELGIPVVVMEPVKGGSLTSFADDINDIFKKERPEDSVASWALRFVGSLPNVKVVLSGMSTMEQVEDNLKTFDKFEPLSDRERKIIADVIVAVKTRVKNGCTNCNYCMPCPFGIDIPRNFAVWNEHSMYHNRGSANWQYFNELGSDKRADQCKRCAKCEKMCPQGIQIREDLSQVAKDMDAIKW